MNYLIAVLKDRIEAEEAYSALEKEGLPMDKVTILGRGYKSADEFGLIEPGSEAKKQALRLAYWTIPFGFAAGFAFNLQTGIEIVEWAGSLGNHIIGGIFGAIAGAMGSFFAGGGTGLIFSSGDALPYRNLLKEGKYLIAVKGSESLTLRATPILRQFNPENIQGYVDPDSV
ncbi:MAG TPA: hypothetical protein DCE56_31865 [Cyanobacteria bacterium UBA8553]|nr:hypothetical protein [Cyanobacteria bacterium UBA8553]HAJ59725.1 hypothetical protein [Cyanobacteria bacterium UBA8543]